MATDSKRKIRIGIYDLGRQGGSTRYLHDLLSALPRDQYEIYFFPAEAAAVYGFPVPETSPSLPCTAAEKSERRLAQILWRCLPSSWRLAAGLARETFALAREIRLLDIDVFHSNYTGFEIAPIAARLAGVRTVAGIFHNLPSEGFITSRWIQLFFENLSGWCLTIPVAVSKATAQEWETRCRTLRNRFRVIYNGVDIKSIQQAANFPTTRAELGIPIDSHVLLVAARLHPMKGIRYLLEAMPTILAEYPSTILLLVGDGPERKLLEEQVVKQNIGNAIKFLGWRDDALRLIPLANIVVQPSVNLETFGYTLTEAMVLGKPVIATDVGGMPEIVEHGETGLIVPRRNSQALADAIIDLLNDPTKATRFGQAGQQRVETLFPMKKMQSQTIALYEQLSSNLSKN